jgi:hypothetical protein
MLFIIEAPFQQIVIGSNHTSSRAFHQRQDDPAPSRVPFLSIDKAEPVLFNYIFGFQVV